MLKLPSKERASFLFRRPGQHHHRNSASQSETLADSSSVLPDISRVDTRSLLNLFDDYQSQGVTGPLANSARALTPCHANTNANNAQGFAWPAQIASGTPATMQNSEGTIARNDSTGSSSQSLYRRSATSSPMTRNSSSSSVMQAALPLATGSVDYQLVQKVNALPEVERHTPVLPAPATEHKKQSRSSTWDSTMSASSRRLNLDKPLPYGPPSASTKDSSRLTPRDKPAAFHESRSESSIGPGSLTKHARSTSMPLTHSSHPQGSTPQLPTTMNSNTTRGARLGNAMASIGTKRRSRSVTFESTPRLKLDPPPQQYESDRAYARASLRAAMRNSISSHTAENVIYRIMCQLDEAKDLQSAALVSKGFYNTFRRNESKLVSHMVFKRSRPAWELRRSIAALQGSKAFTLCEYQRDLRTLDALKAFILADCDSQCKQKTISGLLGRDRQCEIEVDNALWRVWTFCALFGENAAQNPVPSTQLDWLNGSNGDKTKRMGACFAGGNGTGLTVDELEDMSEMWKCIHTLLSRFYGREEEARRIGIFDNWTRIEMGSAQQHLTEWVAYLLTLGPQVVLSLSQGSFEKARMLGLNQWTLSPVGQTRTSFVTAAISQVYQERVLAEAMTKAAQITLPPGPKHRPTRSCDDQALKPAISNRKPLRLDTSSSVVRRRPVSISAAASPSHTTTIPIMPDCDPNNSDLATSSAVNPRSSVFPASPTADPTFFHTLSMTATVSTKLGATLFPVSYASSS